MSDHHIALTGVLAQSGLTPEEQRELLLQLVQDPERVPVGRFPDAPNDYVARAKDLPSSVFHPQFGPTFVCIPFSTPWGPVKLYCGAGPGIWFRKNFSITPIALTGVNQ